MKYHIFIDDFIMDYKPEKSPAYIQGKRFGFVSAIVSDRDLPAIELKLSRLKEKLKVKHNIEIDEFHGSDIIQNKGPWHDIPIRNRVRVLEYILKIAQFHNVHFIGEMVQEGTPEFKDALNRIAETLKGKINEKKGKVNEKVRVRILNSPSLSIATVTRHASLTYVILTLNATEIHIIEDNGIPRDQQITKRWLSRLDEIRVPYETDWNQNSKQWLGLQLADIAATVLHLKFKNEDRMAYLDEKDLKVNFDKFDAFSSEAIRQNIFSLLDMEKRTFRAVNLNLDT